MSELNGANMDTPHTPHLPYRIASEINEHVIRQAEMNDYMLGRAERDDIATDYVYHLLDQNAVSPETVAFDALHLWRRIYGGGVQGA